ncbi:MAG: hypothetical protein L6R40_007938 [Gallowayella cf. fulva]|nr:MAG: hypothetical protein L6R40_007938 [Xanthomendoza cf. fulva]
MSVFASRALRSLPRSSIPRRAILTDTRCFHVSTRKAALSESDHSERQRQSRPLLSPFPDVHIDGDHDRKAKIDEHKDDQLNKQKEGKGHWKKELSSNSEAAVKADRDEISNVEEDIAALQKQTEEAAGSEKK